MAVFAIKIDPETLDISFGMTDDDEVFAAATKPMLARKIERFDVEYPVCAQPKYDGVRCVAKQSGLFTRYGRKITSLPHVEAALAPLFADRPELIVDGELFAAGVSLGGIAADVRTIAPVSTRVSLYVFDVVSECCFSDRIKIAADVVARCASDAVKLVETIVVRSADELDDYYAKCLRDGHEGMMVRLLGVKYRHYRTKALLKRKPFEDAEADVVGLDIHDGEAHQLHLRTPQGVVFKAPISASRCDRRQLARKAHRARSWQATYRFCGLLPSGLPRTPIASVVHEFGRL